MVCAVMQGVPLKSILRELLSAEYNIINASFGLTWIVIALAIVVPTFIWLSSFLRIYSSSKNLPGPRGHPLIGNMLETADPHSLYSTLSKGCKQYGKLFKLRVLNKLLFVMADPAEVKLVVNSLRENHRPEHISKAVSVFCGNGMLSIRDGDVYKAHKRKLFPMFYPAMLKNYQLIFEIKSRSLCQRLSRIPDNETIDMFHYISSYTMEAICSTIVGCDVTNMEGGAKEFVEAIKMADHLIPIVVAKPWLGVSWIQRFFAYGRKLRSTQQCINTFIDRIVADKLVAARNTRWTALEEKEEEGGERRELLSMLDMMLRATGKESDRFSAEDIKDELLTFINAGFMTTATTLSFLFVLLGIHEDVQEEVSRELEEVFGSSLREATTEDLSRLEVLDRVIKETMRLFPAVPLVTRELVDDVHLLSGKVLPAGTNILAYIYQLQRDPEYYHDPDSFIPDRWRPENASLLNPDAYVPFGVGSRTCIGFRYAMLQMKVTASNLLRRFKVTTSLKMVELSNLGISISLILYGGFKVQLHKKELGNM